MRSTLAALALGSLVTLLPAGAQAQQYRYHGSVCQPTNGSRNSVDYNRFGVGNVSTSATVTVECPIAQPVVNGFIASVTVFVYDRNAGSGSPVSCQLQPVTTQGEPTSPILSAQTPAGESASPQVLEFFPDDNDLPAWLWRVRCRIPPRSNGNTSYITSLDLVLE